MARASMKTGALMRCRAQHIVIVMACILLAILMGPLQAAAQEDPEWVIQTIQIPPNDCEKTTCGIPLQQSLPQDTEHLALAQYGINTTCAEVRERHPRLYGEEMKLEFVDVDTPRAWALTYQACTDTTFEAYNYIWQDPVVVGPIPTYVWWYNPCNTTESISYNISRLPDSGPAEEYCSRLESQNDAEFVVRMMILLGGVAGQIVSCVFWFMCTACCTCFCARPGYCERISTRFSKGCYHWIMCKAGGIRFYNENQSTSLLFWSFSASCMFAILALQYPQFDRDDVLSPMLSNTNSWATGLSGSGLSDQNGGDIVIVKFIYSLLFAIRGAIMPFAAIVLNFSDPLRDPSFRSKAYVAGVLIVSTMIRMAFGIGDSWRYFDVWEYKGHQIILQLGLLLLMVMTVVSYIAFVYAACVQRARIKRENGGKLPELLPPVDAAEIQSAPVATVVRTPSNHDAAAIFPPQATSPARPSSNNPLYSNEDPIVVDVQVATGGPVAEAYTGANTDKALDAGMPQNGNPLAEEMENCAPAAAESASTFNGGFWGHVQKFWDSVREDPRIGFRYSVFVSASLMLTFITLSSALLLTLQWVRDLAECTEAESRCLHDVQRWFYKRLVKGLVKVDIETLELQFSGLCDVVGQGSNSTTGTQIRDRLSSNFVTADVVGNCDSVQQLNSTQSDTDQPEWIANGKVPVLVGGHIGFILAYLLGLYTIFHVARAYKKLELKLKAARIAELLWERRSGDLAELGSVVASSSTAYTAGSTKKHKLGKEILEDYKTVSIGQSAYFTGMLVSTCYVQLLLAGGLLSMLLAALLHPQFWEVVGEHIWWPISFVLITLWHMISQKLLNKYVTNGKRIRWPFVWLFAYVALSGGYCAVGLLLALARLIWLLIPSIIALSRLDACLFTMYKGRDRGYASFLAMALMLHSFQECLKENSLEPETITQNPDKGEAQAVEAARAWKHNAASAKSARADAPSFEHSFERSANPNDMEA